MAYISFQPSDHFNTKLYTGNGGNQTITGVGFQPDWVWFKSRDAGNSHAFVDIVRGTNKVLYSDSTSSEQPISAQTFNSDGFALVQDGGANSINSNGSTKVAWSWKAGGGQGSSNTDGSINTTYTSANTTSGFSINLFTATGSAGTIGHGLNAVPKMILVKDTNGTGSWQVYHASLGATKYLALNETIAAGTASNRWNDTTPTSSVFSIGSEWSSGKTLIAYTFAEKKGFSKFSSFVGNGSADGVFCYTGFRPAFVVVKKSSEATGQWRMMDSKRSTSNVVNKSVYANLSNAESSDTMLDFTAQGFKMRSTDQDVNKSGVTYIYMAFAESPIVSSNGVPAVAR